MKLQTRISVVMFALGLMASGCASKAPVQTALDAHAGYNVVMSGLLDARKAGLINDAQKASIEKVRAPVYDAILQMDAAAVADNSPGFTSALKQFRALLSSLQKYLLIYGKPSPTPLK